MQLLVVAGPDRSRTILLTEDGLLRVGRSSECEISLSDPTASRIHFELRIEHGRVFLRDADSRYGSYVNDVQTLDCELRPGDVVRAGETTFHVNEHSHDSRQTLLPASYAIDDSAILEPQATVQFSPQQLVGQSFQNFDVLALLARTSRGFVFRARETGTAADLALKIFLPDRMNPARFLRAVAALKQLDHPHLVKIHAAGEHNGLAWMSSDLVEGESTAQMIQRIGIAGMLDWRHSLRIITQVAEALVFAGEHQLVHRNITPRSILVRQSDGCVKLAGLELIKALDGDSTLAQITQAGEIVGDLPYCSPEQAAGGTVDARADIYNLGATLYALLTGRPPCEGRTLTETLDKIQHEVPASPRTFHLAIPQLLEGIVQRMLAKRPQDRHQSASDLLLDLQRVARYTGSTTTS